MKGRFVLTVSLNEEEKNKLMKLRERGFGNTDVFRKGLDSMYKQIFGKGK